MTETGTTLKKVADAVDPLYKSLDDAQKRRFAMLQRMLAPRRRWPAGPRALAGPTAGAPGTDRAGSKAARPPHGPFARRVLGAASRNSSPLYR